MTLADLLAGAVARLREVGIDGPERDARLLLAEAASIPPDRLTLHLSDPVSDDVASALEPLLAARIRRQPVSQILGRRLFWGRSFRVTPDVLDPRPETETLIDLALQGPPPARLIDLGTGTGCIGLTLLAEWPGSRATLTDASEAALAIARANARDLGLEDRADILGASWWDGIAGMFDLVVSNPPYIAAAEMAGLSPEVRLWEPHGALTPGGDGLSAYRALAAGLGAGLAPEGRALFEIGQAQGADVAEIFMAAGFVASLHADLDGRDRVVSVRPRG